eukprot:TRINITY_DN2432_c0_g1_i2.p1 TRINITY_DN2432_c0_g1~~TRINITY_DN2432_c0_g1_i2.p1  ORF type:complete len:429 (+),score=53.62 TRINITY_DN2432_c0_g1_i2:64-1287(+)
MCIRDRSIYLDRSSESSKYEMEEQKTKEKSNFLYKLYSILDKYEEYGQVLRWEESGDMFEVADRDQLINTVLPLYFRHRNYSSFIRQLNIYGFQKGKNVNGHDVFKQVNFLKGKKSLLKFISRNQNKLEMEEAKRGVKESKLVKTKDLSETLLSEIHLLQKKQLELKQQLLSINLKEKEDLSTQMMLTSFYHQDIQSTLGTFTLFILSEYSNRHSKTDDLLDHEQVALFNRNIKSWIGGQEPDKECAVARKICFTFNLNCFPRVCVKKPELLMRCKRFIKWLNKFLSKNSIYFPFVDLFFYIMIHNSLNPSTQDPSIHGENEYINQINVIAEKIFGEQYDSSPSLSISSSPPLMDSSIVESPSSTFPTFTESKSLFYLEEKSDPFPCAIDQRLNSQKRCLFITTGKY